VRGTIAIVTGGDSGVGLETTRALAEPGTTVVVPLAAQRQLTLSSAASRSSNSTRWI
jgi:NAD(P)-dependent dehydrogenase (short-subunit alcohol dehydrogenase family)